MACRNGSSQTTWYCDLSSEDTLQFFKEERLEGAVYNVYLKKVRYHSSGAEDGNDEDDDGKARLQWRLQEIKVIKCGSVERLVEALSSETGDIDSNYVNTFLSTFRSFSTTSEVLKLLLNRYQQIGEDCNLKQQHKEGHCKSLKTILLLWLVHFTEDFDEPPHYPGLQAIQDFATRFMPESDVPQRAQEQINKFVRDDEATRVVHVEDIDIGLRLDLLHPDTNSVSVLSRPVSLLNTPSNIFAQQLTHVDAELFRKVVPHHCLGSVWSRRDKMRGEAASVFATVHQFNAVSYRVIATILKHPDLPPVERVETVEKWIEVAQELRQLKNFSSLKAIISGLQSNSIYRLQRVWSEVDRDKMITFKELASIFSEENNQLMVRDLLNKEGTAKFADPDNTGTIKSHSRRKSGSGWGTNRSRKSNLYQENSPQIASGTVPYLGTFLTDLTMVDTAMKDLTEEGLVNFDKKRKEFEILAQIKMLQAAAHMYRIKPEPAFFEWFHSIRVYDDNESYELSCEIEPVNLTVPKDIRGHRKKSSLGFFTPRRPMSMTLEGLFRSPSTGSLVDDSTSVISAPELETPIKGLAPPSRLKHSVSSGSLNSLTSHDTSPWRNSSESLVVKVFLETVDSDVTSNYKSIMVSNSDHTRNVVKNILLKFNLSDRPDVFALFQVLPDKEIQLPERGNIFYAITTNVPELRFVMRRRTEMDRLKSRKYNKAKLYKFTV